MTAQRTLRRSVQGQEIMDGGRVEAQRVSRSATESPSGTGLAVASKAGARLVAYERVSTARQGASGLGLEAQRKAIADFAASPTAEVLAHFTEVESGREADRPELAKALHLAKVPGSTLVIARLDRLSRNAAFLLALRDSGMRFLAVDMPEANDLTIGIMAPVAEAEREAISQRTKDALAAARARGVTLGNPTMARPASGAPERAAWRCVRRSRPTRTGSRQTWGQWSQISERQGMPACGPSRQNSRHAGSGQGATENGRCRT